MARVGVAMLAVGLMMAGAQTASAGDVAAGEKVFGRLCKSCHILEAEGPRRMGPTLAGLNGRKAGSVEGFNYSPAYGPSKVIWNAETLDTYLKNPREMMPKTRMVIRVANDAQRADLIAFLQTVK